MEEQVILGHLEQDEELSGLGATQKKAIANRVIKLAQTVQDRKSVVPTAVLRLNTRRDILSLKQRESLAAGNSAGVYMHHYRAVKVTPAADGLIVLIKTDVAVETGISSFKDNVLNSGEVMLIDEIAFSWGFDSTITAPELIEYSSYGIPYPLVQNMEVKIELGSNLVLDHLPMREFLRWEANAAPNSLHRNNLAVKMPVDSFLWSDEQALKITLMFPKTVTIPASINFFCRVDLYGAGIGPKG